MSGAEARSSVGAPGIAGKAAHDRPCVVVGYDGSDSARHAASWAASSLPAAGRLVLVHACRPQHDALPRLASSDQRRAGGRALIDELVLDGDDVLFGVSLQAEVRDLDPVTALTEAAQRHGADTIVIGAHPHSLLQEAIGTVTGGLLARARLPVTVVPAPDEEG
jgi:nucleotide-binding universal stress UspA family protein